jgi:polyketide biosynthesis acyl carrier protein
MNRDEMKGKIIEVVTNNIVKNIDGIEKGTIDIKKSMKDYGANSLDIIEVVSCSMRELNLKIPRTELSNLTTIEGLVEKFLEHMK